MGEAGLKVNLGCAASTTYYQGAIICRNAAGYAIPGSTATTLVSAGVYQGPTFTSSPIAGADKIDVDGGIYKVANSSAGDLVTIADVGSVGYIVDDQTGAKTNGTNTRSVGGAIIAVDSDGFWMELSLTGRKA
jgi:hypothetical protein